MAYLLIHCETCGGHFEVYHRGNLYGREQRMCPHCGEVINEQTWNKFILPAWGQVIDTNTELVKDHANTHTGLFTVDIIADHLYENRNQHQECLIKDFLEQISN